MENAITPNDLLALPIQGGDLGHAVYANNVDLATSPWDVRLVFTELVGSGTPTKIEKFLRAHVVMTPSHAKALIQALSNTLLEHEKAYGTIKMPEPPQVGGQTN